MDIIQDIVIDELAESPAGQKLTRALEVYETVQRHLAVLAEKSSEEKLTLLKIGTVFQLFLVDTLASGKQISQMTEEDWKGIASKVSKYAILEEEQCYSEFVFSTYADYIDLSAKLVSQRASENNVKAIREIAKTLRENGKQLRAGKLTEPLYVEACLWLLLEAMIKLLCTSLTMVIGEEYGQLAQAVSQMAFEYGRYVLYAKEQRILTEYLQNQRVLDERLQKEYDAFLADLQEQADDFRALIDDAFSPDIQAALHNSAELARAAGVKEDEILKTTEDVDAFFMD